MDNITDMNKKLKQLEELLQTHDWYYAMSDDNYYYGEMYIENLVGLLSRLEDINAGYIDCENCDEID